MLARACMGRLRYTSATDYIAFIGDHWYEDRPKALGIIEDFMDDQLIDAEDKIRMAEEALVAIGISKPMSETGKGPGKPGAREKLGLLYALLGADAYKNSS